MMPCRAVPEGVEDPAAVAAAEVQDRVAAPTVDDQAIVSMAAGVGHPVGVQPPEELVIARLFIHQIGDREVHGGLRTGGRCEWNHPTLPRPDLAVNYQHTTWPT